MYVFIECALVSNTLANANREEPAANQPIMKKLYVCLRLAFVRPFDDLVALVFHFNDSCSTYKPIFEIGIIIILGV